MNSTVLKNTQVSQEPDDTSLTIFPAMAQEDKDDSHVNGLPSSLWRQLYSVRVDLWTSGLGGLVVGGFAGAVIHSAAKMFSKNKKSFNKNTLTLAVFATAATGSYLGSVVNGKRSLYNVLYYQNAPVLPPIQRNNDDNDLQRPMISSYQSKLLENNRQIAANLDESFHRRAETLRKRKESDNA